MDIDDLIKQQNYSLLSTLNILFTSHTMSTLLYEIVKLYKECPESSIMKIRYPQESAPEVINILK